MKMKILLICILLLSSTACSQNTKDSPMKDQKNTNQESSANNQASNLVYQKIVHFTVKQNQVDKFVKWLDENQKEFAETLPTGWKFLGCYRTMFHTGRHAWQFRYEIEGMGAYDNLILAENKTSDRLFEQIYTFIDRQIPMEIEILKEITSDAQKIEKE